MTKLDANLLALAMRKLNNALEWIDLRVLPQARVFGCDSTLRGDGSCFYQSNPRSSLDDTPEMSKVPCCVVTIFRRILTKWRELGYILASGRWTRNKFGGAILTMILFWNVMPLNVNGWKSFGGREPSG